MSYAFVVIQCQHDQGLNHTSLSGQDDLILGQLASLGTLWLRTDWEPLMKKGTNTKNSYELIGCQHHASLHELMAEHALVVLDIHFNESNGV